MLDRRLTLVDSSSSGNDTDGGSGGSRDGLLGSGRETQSGLVLVDRVSDDGSVVTRGSGKRSSVSDGLLDLADDGSLGALVEGEDVSDREGGLLSAVDERPGGHSLGGDEGLLSELVSVGVSEGDLGEGRSSSGVVDDVLHDSSHVTVPLGKVESSESRRLLSVVRVGLQGREGKEEGHQLGHPLLPGQPIHLRCAHLEDPSGLPLVQNDSLWEGKGDKEGTASATGSRQGREAELGRDRVRTPMAVDTTRQREEQQKQGQRLLRNVHRGRRCRVVHRSGVVE